MCLLYVIDLSQPDPIHQFEALQFELEQYEKGLSKRPHAILANKIDTEEAKANLEGFEEYAGSINVPVFQISGKMGLNLSSVLKFIRTLYDENSGDVRRKDLGS